MRVFPARCSWSWLHNVFCLFLLFCPYVLCEDNLWNEVEPEKNKGGEDKKSKKRTGSCSVKGSQPWVVVIARCRCLLIIMQLELLINLSSVEGKHEDYNRSEEIKTKIEIISYIWTAMLVAWISRRS